MRSPPRGPAALLLALALAAPAPALAQPSNTDKAVAESLFHKAIALEKDGQVAQACAAYAESNRLDPAFTTLVRLGKCHDKVGRSMSAWVAYDEAGKLARAARAPERVEAAQALWSEVGKRLAKVLLEGTPVEGMRLSLDGGPLSASVLGVPFPQDPGEHVLTVEAPGRKRWEGKINLPAGPTTLTVAIPTLAPDVAEPPPPPPPPPPLVRVVEPPLPPAPAPRPSGSPSLRIAGGVTGGVGLAGVVVGSIFGGLAFSTESAARDLCPALKCATQAGLDKHDTARRQATISTVAMSAGGAALATGVVLLVLGFRGDKPATSAWLAPTPGGLALGGKF